LLYVTAGAAIADLDQTSGGSRSNELKGGFTVGAGVETALARNWTVKAEYLYLDFGSTTFQGTNGSITSQVQEHVFRIGANFHFDPNFLAKP
jgi:outer membrane immunogenic protein